MIKLYILSLLVALSLAFTGVTWADIYKYSDPEGRILLTNIPTKDEQYALEKRFRFKKYANPSSGGTLASYAVLKHRVKTYAPLITEIAAQLELDEDLIHAVILAESAYDHKAVSSAGAVGLMQLMPATAQRFGVNDSYDPKQNITGGATYLKKLLALYDQNLQLTLAAYNAGEGAVAKYGRQIPPYKETQGYVKKVLAFHDEGMEVLRK